ncbi:hypothetical protein CFC21_107768 [Triticum aestivum]|uniref:DUF6598 domain-containing protein n=2 Tax=Triticum aestivum TaxID=4565 RepID=A0A3B6TEL1_WHEAT|nr:uncharacterized protein LOC123168272 isoform X1 [Triticum aestivum]KAF7107088.1 hypothetical protein CFC21_107768 [Triticum aestivum]
MARRSTDRPFLMARKIAVHGQMNRSKSTQTSHLPCANAFFCTLGEQFAATNGKNRGKMRKETKKVNVRSAFIIDNSTHRDESIYRNSFLQKICGVTNRDETQLEPMMLSDPIDCFPDRERCAVHYVCNMMQIFSLKLAKVPVITSSVQLYGYIAVRDCLDSLLNYIFNRSRDDPITVQQGSLIEMTGPKRGITMTSPVLVEFDMRIRKGEQEEDDLQLIDGAIDCELTTPSRPSTNRINGDCGAVDITLARVPGAVEATIDVVISKVQSGFNLSLSSFVFAGGSHQGIELFCGIIGEPCGLTRRYVIAVEMGSWMYLKFNVGQKGSDMMMIWNVIAASKQPSMDVPVDR